MHPHRLSKPASAHSEDRELMKIAPWYLAALAPFAAIGYSGAHLGHAFVVLLTVGIFLGTVTMGGRIDAQEPRTDP
jgi:hypothetical protein